MFLLIPLQRFMTLFSVLEPSKLFNIILDLLKKYVLFEIWKICKHLESFFIQRQMKNFVTEYKKLKEF